jgi:hypothetical protein
MIAQSGSVKLGLHRESNGHSKGTVCYSIFSGPEYVMFPSTRVMNRLARAYLRKEKGLTLVTGDFGRKQPSRFPRRTIWISFEGATSHEQRAAFLGAVCANTRKA